jgi:hypothetical protein
MSFVEERILCVAQANLLEAFVAQLAPLALPAVVAMAGVRSATVAFVGASLRQRKTWLRST